jgi:hypothetical protein
MQTVALIASVILAFLGSVISAELEHHDAAAILMDEDAHVERRLGRGGPCPVGKWSKWTVQPCDFCEV